MIMSEEGCRDYEAEKGSNFCKHYCGNIFNGQQIFACYLNCSLSLIKEHGEIDVDKCK